MFLNLNFTGVCQEKNVEPFFGYVREECFSFRQSVGLLRFPDEDWVRDALGKFSLRLGPATLEVEDKCANHFVTEAPLRNQIKEPQDKKRIFISNYTRT
jgi:hypothetical protein